VQATETLAEARRLMTICNSCRYCEGLCAVFPAMEMRRAFPDGDLTYLANLCHGCGACYIDCQFSPPHEFQVNVPKVLAGLRRETYAKYAWPKSLSFLFRRNGFVITLSIAASIAAFVAAFLFAAGPAAFFSVHNGSGAFYWLMPHGVMAWLFGGVFVLACAALAMEQWRFYRGTNAAQTHGYQGIGAIWEAARDAGRLRYLDGGGAGCYSAKPARQDRRRLFHHFTFYGFLLCFASTLVATLYHYLLGLEAPYAWYDLPVVLGVFGGLGLLAGPLGLIWGKRARDADISDVRSGGMDAAFLAALLLTSATGFALLLLRNSAMMSLLLAIHLGTVLALFATLPYGRFVHGLYRFAALVRYAREKKALLQSSA
jgi:citrate/tricarballylate utilization protein